MVDMEAVRQFNSELSTIYETKPPISKGKVASITRLAVKAIKYYKHVVQSVEKFTQKCRQEYKVPALYIIDSIIRQSRHQFGADKDVFGPRFAKSITITFQHLYKCPPEDQGRIVKVLNLWQKGGVYSPEVVQPLLNMAQQCQNEEPSQNNKAIMSSSSSSSALNIGNETQPSDSIPGNGTSVVTALQQQQQQHLEQIENLRRQLQEQQSINQQQQQQLAQQLSGINNPMAMPKPMPMEQTVPFGNVQVQQGVPQAQPQQQGVLQTSQAGVPPDLGGAQNVGDDQPRFQLQPHVLAQIQALTGMNIRLPHLAPNQEEVQGEPAPNQQAPPNLGPETGVAPLSQGLTDQGSSWGHPALAPLARHPDQTHQQPPRKDQGVIDDFDYGDEQDDATRLAEQRRRLMEEERRLSQDQMTVEGDRHHNRSPGHRRRSQSPYRRNRSPRRKSRSPRRRSRSPRSREGRERGRDKDRERERGRDRDRERERDRDKDRADLEEEPENKGLPPVIPNSCSVCSNTIWVGHLAKTVQQNDLQEIFAEYGEVTSIDMVPPRGCAYVQMAKREDASKALNKLANLRLHGNFVKFAWAPAKGVKDRKFKEYFNVSLGVTYIPWEVLGSAPDLLSIAEGGWIDPESLPVELKSLKLAEAGETTGDDKGEAKEGEQANPLAAGVLPPQIPTHLPPPPIFPPMMPPHMMMRPPFQGGPPNPTMMPPERPPWGMNVPGGPPPGFGQGVQPPQGMRPPGGGQFPHHQASEGRPPFQPRIPMGMPPRGQEPGGGMRPFRPRFHEGPRPRGPMEFERPPRRDFDGPPRHRGFGGPPPRGHNGPPPRGPEGMIPRGLEGPPSGMDEPQRRQDMPPQGIEEPQRVTEGPYGMDQGVPRGPEGAPRGPEGPRSLQDGPLKGDEGPPRPEGPRQDSEGPPQVQHEGPPRGPNGPYMRFEGPHANMENMPGGPMRPPFRGMNGPPGAPNGPPPRGPEGLLREPDFRLQFRPDFRGGPRGPPPRHWGPPHDRPMGMPPMRMPHPEWLRGPPPPERINEEQASTDVSASNEQHSGPKEERPEPRPDRPEQPEKLDNRSSDEHGDSDRGQHVRRDRDRNERVPWERERDRDRRRDRDRPRSRERDRDRGRDRSRDRETSRDRDRYRETSRDRERERSHDRETSRDRERRDRDRRDRDRDRDRRDRDRDRRDRDRRRSYNDRDSRKSSDSDNKYDRQIKSEFTKEIPTTADSKEGVDAAAGQTGQPMKFGQASNENVQNASADPSLHNNKIATPEEGEVIEDENNSHITTANENKQVEFQNEASNDIKIKIEGLKSAVEDPLKTTEEQRVVQNSTGGINAAGMKIEIKQETNSEQMETT